MALLLLEWCHGTVYVWYLPRSLVAECTAPRLLALAGATHGGGQRSGVNVLEQLLVKLHAGEREQSAMPPNSPPKPAHICACDANL